MPLYDFKCRKCGKVHEAFAGISERESICSCGSPADRLLSAPVFKPPMQPYISPVTGKWVEGERMRRDDLARNRCIAYDPEMRKDADRTRAENDAKLDRSIDTAVERAVAEVQH